MAWLLNLIYAALLCGLSPWLVYSAVRHGKYRHGLSEKLFGLVPPRRGDRRCVWFHAVSVGEVNLLQPLLERFEREFPDWEVVISATTVTGHELARKKYAPRPVFYCPLDFSWAVSHALARVRPDVLILAELELWPNLIRIASRRGVRLAIVNGRLSDKSARGYGRIRWLVSRLLPRFDFLAVQSDEYAGRFLTLGARPESVVVTGNVKFDGAPTDRGQAKTRHLAALAGLADDDVVFLAGSTQAPEESLALDAFRDLSHRFPRLRLIVVPRHKERFEEVANLLRESGLPFQRRSRLEADGPDRAARVLLVDTIGELGAWWGTAMIGFVGGSLGTRGGQNMLEPSGYGVAVSFGPRTQNFRDIVALLRACDGCVVVQDGAELQRFVLRCLEDPAWARDLGQRARALVLSQQGATERTIQLLRQTTNSQNAALGPGERR